MTRASDSSHSRTRKRQQHDEPVEVVSGRWLVRAILLCLVVAGIALYLSVCLLVYQGQWQFVFATHPSKTQTAAQVSQATGLTIRDVDFDYTEEGQPRLNGWWIPAADANAPVILFCPGGRTPLAENIDSFRALHTLGVSVFAFEYRGMGQSRKGHPSQQKAYADGASALAYLIGMRNIPAQKIVLYGVGAGAAVAAHVAAQGPANSGHSGIAALILQDPQLSLTGQVRREQHIHALPMRLVFTDNFAIRTALPTLNMPKLIFSTKIEREYPEGARQVYADAPAPKQLVATGALSSNTLYNDSTWQSAMQGFLRSAMQSH